MENGKNESGFVGGVVVIQFRSVSFGAIKPLGFIAKILVMKSLHTYKTIEFYTIEFYTLL
jgi:hypothetical protein